MTIALTFLFAFALILGAIAVMALGVMRGRPPIKGSCGGLNGGGCELCSGRCRRESPE